MTWPVRLDLTWFDLTWPDPCLLYQSSLDQSWLDLSWLDLSWLDVSWLDLTWLDLSLIDLPLLVLSWLDLFWLHPTCGGWVGCAAYVSDFNYIIMPLCGPTCKLKPCKISSGAVILKLDRVWLFQLPRLCQSQISKSHVHNHATLWPNLQVETWNST